MDYSSYGSSYVAVGCGIDPFILVVLLVPVFSSSSTANVDFIIVWAKAVAVILVVCVISVDVVRKTVFVYFQFFSSSLILFG